MNEVAMKNLNDDIEDIKAESKLENKAKAISIKEVTVAYRSYLERPTSLKESFLRILRGKLAKNFTTFDALSNVTFDAPTGKVFGIIGSNGSGKSTLLKVLAGVLKPTHGTVKVNGTVASLIELGVGFDPELNAIENIYLHGSLHKKSKAEIKERISSVLEFAELSDYAKKPVKYYSSGMWARLGFAVAFDINPDILLIDEILAVGDERFQSKCQAVFKSFLNSGKTVVLVSHDLTMIQNNADTVALMSKGQLVFLGDPKEAVNLYRSGSYQRALG